jgi:hypothetical protein
MAAGQSAVAAAIGNWAATLVLNVVAASAGIHRLCQVEA